VPVDIVEVRGQVVSGSPVKRWVNHDGQWRLFRISESDPRWSGTVAYDPAVPRPDRSLTAARVAAGHTEPEQPPEKPAVAPEPEIEEGRAAPNKARRTSSGGRRRATTKSTTEQGEGGQR
jgi:hypothetical protein